MIEKFKNLILNVFLYMFKYSAVVLSQYEATNRKFSDAPKSHKLGHSNFGV